MGSVGRLTRIDLNVPPGPAAAAELTRLTHELPAGITVAVATQRARAGLDMTQAFTTNLRALGLLALLVGLFLVYGTMSFAIVQRRRSLGILRALGATRAQLLRIIAFEAVGLALVGGASGLVAGALIGRELVGMVSRTINDLYYVVAVNSVALPAGEPLLALGAALAVALLAAAVPAMEAVQSAPQLALRASVLEGRARRVTLGLLALSLLLALACAGLVVTTQRSVLAGFAALVLAMLSVAAATPAVLYGFGADAGTLAGLCSPARASGIGRGSRFLEPHGCGRCGAGHGSGRDDWHQHHGRQFPRVAARLAGAHAAGGYLCGSAGAWICQARASDRCRACGRPGARRRRGRLQREPARRGGFGSRPGGAGCHGQHAGHARRC